MWYVMRNSYIFRSMDRVESKLKNLVLTKIIRAKCVVQATRQDSRCIRTCIGSKCSTYAHGCLVRSWGRPEIFLKKLSCAGRFMSMKCCLKNNDKYCSISNILLYTREIKKLSMISTNSKLNSRSKVARTVKTFFFLIT
jgi:hypothetical protein